MLLIQLPFSPRGSSIKPTGVSDSGDYSLQVHWWHHISYTKRYQLYQWSLLTLLQAMQINGGLCKHKILLKLIDMDSVHFYLFTCIKLWQTPELSERAGISADGWCWRVIIKVPPPPSLWSAAVKSKAKLEGQGPLILKSQHHCILNHKHH